MTACKAEDNNLVSSLYEDGGSPGKKMRTDNMGRKSWSLMDRKTDHEVLQEMGVRLLEPDDSEPCETGSSGMIHKTFKLHRDIENVNPNINLVTSPRSKCSPRSKMSPNAGPSKIKSPRSAEKNLLTTDQQFLETTFSEDYLIDEETPLAQSVSAQYLPQNQTVFSDCSSSGRKRRYTRPLADLEEVICRRHKPEPTGTDAFNILSDEMILSVFRWLPKRTLAHCMMVCKRWHRVACDESLWQRLELGNKTLSKDALGRILARKPIIVRLASSEIGEWHPTCTPVPARIQYLDLSMATLDVLTLNSLLLRCESLKKLSLESVIIEDSTCQLIGKCSNLETLNLTMAQGVTAAGLNYILTGCNSIQSLNISWCNLDEAALEVLVTTLPVQLQRLNISGARIMTDEYIEKLVERCPHLVELDSSDCARLTEKSAAAVLNLHSLEHLALSRCYLLPASALAQLNSSRSLQFVEAWGSLPAHAQCALRAALPRVRLNHFMFSAIARPTVGTRRTSIWGLRTRD